jgi:anti-sigma factor RsiW
MRLRIFFLLTCRDVTEHATGFMEGDLPVRARLAVRLHLAVCRMCRAYMEQLHRTRGFLQGRALAAPPPDVEAQIVARARQQG